MFVHESDNKYLVIVDKDEPLMETLTKVAKEHKILGGSITGIGAIKNVELGFYELETKTYHRKMFDQGDFELTSLVGNISLKDGEPFVHAHITMGGLDFNVKGGHLFAADIAVTGEFYIIPFKEMPVREHNEAIGLDLICKMA